MNTLTPLTLPPWRPHIVKRDGTHVAVPMWKIVAAYRRIEARRAGKSA